MRRRVSRHPLGGGFDPARVAGVLEGVGGDLAWLDSGADGLHYFGTGERIVPELGAVLPALREELARIDLDRDPAGPAFQGGLVGWLGYEVREETTGIPVAGPPRSPDAAFLRLERLVVVDSRTGEAELIGLEDDSLPAWIEETTAALLQHPAGRVLTGAGQKVPRRPPAHPPAVRWWHDRDSYLDNVRACIAAIQEGETYQLCLTTQAEVEGEFDAFEVYLAMRGATHHGGFLRIGGTTLLSASPERFLELDAAGVVRSRPIKGTRPRDADPGRDAALAAELRASDKEQAENLMIVDLMRNDLSKVCALGSVAVTSLLAVESYPAVHQLVSEVAGRLRPGLSAVDAFAACFPAGSMTGAPKLRATEILDALEGRRRGIYSGAFGFLGFDGCADLAMVIRSIVLDAERATIGAGGGITALSIPEEEYDEMRLKARALLRALGVEHD